MILVDETKLWNGVIELIGNCYDKKFDHSKLPFDEDAYQEFIEEIVEELRIDG